MRREGRSGNVDHVARHNGEEIGCRLASCCLEAKVGGLCRGGCTGGIGGVWRGGGVKGEVLVCVLNFLSYKAIPIGASHIPSVPMSGLPFI